MNYQYISSMFKQLQQQSNQQKYVLIQTQQLLKDFIFTPDFEHYSETITQTVSNNSTFHSQLSNLSYMQMRDKLDDLRISVSEDMCVEFDVNLFSLDDDNNFDLQLNGMHKIQ
ncbi:Hypothetical_protein [Hexamita inflata]|uniref:Hypothetical_protein n=1 Tax=Hexamita inflata TaxID=28002 RepID=A0AA86R372_9EUKA|nr:Hypothetical protein HINF_LOCUS57305 [Hexamita inflata]